MSSDGGGAGAACAASCFVYACKRCFFRELASCQLAWPCFTPLCRSRLPPPFAFCCCFSVLVVLVSSFLVSRFRLSSRDSRLSSPVVPPFFSGFSSLLSNIEGRRLAKLAMECGSVNVRTLSGEKAREHAATRQQGNPHQGTAAQRHSHTSLKPQEPHAGTSGRWVVATRQCVARKRRRLSEADGDKQRERSRSDQVKKRCAAWTGVNG